MTERILMLGPRIASLDEVKNFGSLWSYYLEQEFLNRGIDMMWRPMPLTEEECPGEVMDYCTHILALGHRAFSKVDPKVLRWCKAHSNGGVAQLHDGPQPKVDCLTLAVRDDRWRLARMAPARQEHFRRWTRHVGWAVDTEVCLPRQRKGEFCILVDHGLYKPGPDTSLDVAAAAIHFAATKKISGADIVVRRLVDGGAEDLVIQSLRPFTRQHVPWPEMVQEYGRAHVFMPTHRESAGLTCLEAAACGALVVARKGHIPADLIKTIRAYEYGPEGIDWDKVMKGVSIRTNRAYASRHTWRDVADKILLALREPS